METKKLIILFIGLLWSACSEEIPQPAPPGDPQGKVPVTFQLTLAGDTKTRADDWPYERFFPEITEKEQKISNILLVVFKNAILEEYNFYTAGDFVQEGDNSITLSSDEEGDILQLEPGPHFFYAMANLPDDLIRTFRQTLEGMEEVLKQDDFERIILEQSMDYLTGRNTGFIMTNSTPPNVRNIYSEEQMEIANNYDLNKIVLEIGRAVAKISFAYVASEEETGELHGSLSDIRYKLFNNPAQMYLMPVMENNLLLTPHYDRNYHTSGYFTPWIKGTDLMDDTPETPWLPATTPESLQNGEEMKFCYCIENHNKSPLKSTSTMLLIEAVFTPALWLNGDGTPGEESQDGTFYRIGQFNANNVLYAYTRGYYNEEPVEVLAELMKEGIPATGPYKAVKYEKGITYYGFWPSNNDRFQVKRNNHFKIAITHVHGAGYPGPEGPVNPDIDPDEKGTRGRLEVTVDSWVEENRIIIAGEDPDENPDINSGIQDWEEGNQDDKTLEGGDDKNKFN